MAPRNDGGPQLDLNDVNKSPDRKTANGANGNARTQVSPSWAVGRSVNLHDDMNLLVLSVMSAAAAAAMYFHGHKVQYGLTCFAAGYMVFDAIWIASTWYSVKSPRTVLGHHVATLLVLADPLLQPQHAFYSACALLVEFNTVLLILRRRVAWGGAVEVPFVISWVALRLIWYPFLGFYMLMCTFPEWGTEVFPQVLVDWRVRVEGHRPVPMFGASYVAWVGICIFQGWWSMKLYNTYKRQLQTPRGTTATKKYL